jgi:hypothetical protein
MDTLNDSIRYCYGIDKVASAFKVVDDDEIDHTIPSVGPILITQAEQDFIYDTIKVVGDFETGIMIDQDDVRSIGIECIRKLRYGTK